MSSRSFLLLALGAAAGVAFVLSCGNSPGTADAADSCNCPAAEPPLAGRIVTIETHGTLTAQNQDSIGASCAAGATVLGGSCGQDSGPDKDVVLLQAKVVGQEWRCSWNNASAAPMNVTIGAICLNPAQ